MRRALLAVLLLSCGTTQFIPSPDGGNGGGTSGGGSQGGTGGGNNGGGSGSTGGGGATNGGGTSSTGGGSGATGGGMGMGGSCTSACDCTPGLACVQGTCQSGVVSVYCCESSCPPNNVCQHMDGMYGQCMRGDAGFATPDGGACQSACDCPTGQACFNGSCFASPQPLYCCTDPVCPTMARCQNPTGGMPHRCGSDGGMGPPPNDGGGFDYCPFIPCNASDAGLCMMAGCSMCSTSGTCLQ